MGRVMKVLAIVVLLVTVIAAGIVLYGINTMMPQVVQAGAAAMPALQAQESFDLLVSQIEEQTFMGRVYASTDNLNVQECTFVTYTVRLQNRGFFPAEWITLEVTPKDENDVLMLASDSARVLPAGSMGDLTATILCRGDAQDMARRITVSCYVFGQMISFDMDVQ